MERISYLLLQQLRGMLTPAETEELASWRQQSPEHAAALDKLSDPAYLQKGLSALEQAKLAIDQGLMANGVLRAPVRVRTMRKWWWAAAAAILLAVGATYYRMQTVPEQDNMMLAGQIGPASGKATLTLADGTVITLDSAGNRLIQQEGAAIRQAGEQLSYDAKNSTVISYNTLTTPRGGQFRVKLPDGTNVWLNAASSLYYPVSFSGKERRVKVNGEAYFEVAKDAAKPFRVEVAGGAVIDVLGTGFNVNAYDQRFQTTLLEGAVRIAMHQHAVTLRPGEQAVAAEGQQRFSVRQADIGQVMAWKNGIFNFENASLKEVMHELERWYDIVVVYEKGIPDIHFGGEISRHTKLSDVLKMLSRAEVNFRMEEGRKLIVLP